MPSARELHSIPRSVSQASDLIGGKNTTAAPRPSADLFIAQGDLFVTRMKNMVTDLHFKCTGTTLEPLCRLTFTKTYQLCMTTTGLSISDTPPEILERILDFLHDDLAALYSASLVNREWVHSPRHHLFSRMLITELYGRGRLMSHNAHSFLALAQSEHCTILPAIQYITLVITTPVLIDSVVKILARSKALSQITYIHLTQSDLLCWDSHALTNISDFAFEFTWFRFADEAWHLVTSFPDLHTLSLYTYARTIITLPADVSRSTFHSLQTLHLRLVASEELLEWLMDLTGTHLALETLDLQMFRSCHSGWGAVNVLNSLLKELSDTLKNLSIGIDYDVDLENKSLNNGPCIDLTTLVNLRSLFLRTHDLSAVCDTLETLRSSSTELEVLTVHALRWEFDRYSKNKQCDCIPSHLLVRFAGLIEEKQFYGSQVINLSIPEGSDLDITGEPLRKLVDKGTLKLGITHGHVQRNTLDAIRPLIWTSRV